ncbi:hypothetical protein [Luteimonas aquatica]|nr:hypothetical protein [Luteimonas aquatica]
MNAPRVRFEHHSGPAVLLPAGTVIELEGRSSVAFRDGRVAAIVDRGPT